MSGQDLARSRYRPLRKAFEAVDDAARAAAGSVARLEGLRAQLGPAEHRDRVALAQALIEGKPDPVSEADRLRVKIDREQRNLDALGEAVQAAEKNVRDVIAGNVPGWGRQIRRDLSRAANRYRDAITELESAREALNDETALISFLSGRGDGAAATDRLLSDGHFGGREPVSFAALLDWLRVDADEIAEQPSKHSGPQLGLRLEGSPR